MYLESFVVLMSVEGNQKIMKQQVVGLPNTKFNLNNVGFKFCG